MLRLIDTTQGVPQNELGFVDGEMLEQEPVLVPLNSLSSSPLEYDILVVNT